MGYDYDSHSKPNSCNGSDLIASDIENCLVTHKIYISSKHQFEILRIFKVGFFNKLHPPIQSLTTCRMFLFEFINYVFTEKPHVYNNSKLPYYGQAKNIAVWTFSEPQRIAKGTKGLLLDLSKKSLAEGLSLL